MPAASAASLQPQDPAKTAFEEWVQIKREEYHRVVLDMLRQLADSYEWIGAYDHACDYIWQQLTLDPWREEAHRQLSCAC